MLPQSAPVVAGYALRLAYRPACFATGDYHDFFACAGGDTSAFIGDASGHGPSASLLAATVRAILLTHPELHGDPGHCLTAVGRLLYPLVPADRFVTGLYLRLGRGGRLTWASAGHDPPLRVSRLGRTARPDLAPVGLPLGIQAGEVYQTVTWDLRPGERLLAFTDGLAEARSPAGDSFGRERLSASLEEFARLPLEDLVPALVARVAEHQEGSGFEDDFSLLAVERQTTEQPGRGLQPHEAPWTAC
jgi:sigma-B regulation protein RsbU (phosphoserine phosphatase)